MFRVLVISSIAFLVSFGTTAQQSGHFGVFGSYRLSPVSVNSPQNEYAPVPVDGSLLFTSDNRERLGVYFSSADSSARLMNLFRAPRIDDTLFGEPELLDNRLNRFCNSGPGNITAAGDRVFFSSNEEAPFLVYTSRSKAPLRIYMSRFDGKRWSEKEPLPFAQGEGNYTHPFAMPGGDTLFFASDRAGGYGRFDLYRSVLRDGEWSEPENLGPDVNSTANELFPTIAGRELWYSTDRPDGTGGLDIVGYSLNGDPVIQKQVPFNSPHDDFGFYPLDARKGYFSSNRSGNDDLYFYTQLFPDFRDCEPYVRDPFCFTFFEDTEELDSGLALAYEWQLGDGTVVREREAHHCFQGYGEYLVELNIVDRTTSEVYFTEASYPFAIEPSERLHLEGPDTIPTGGGVVYSALRSLLPGRTIAAFYWELDGGRRRWANADTIVLELEEPGARTLVLGADTEDSAGRVETVCVVKEIVAVDGYVLPLPAPKERLHDGGARKSSGDSTIYTLFLGVSDTLINDLSLNHGDTVRVDSVGDSLYLYSVGATNDKFALLGDYREAKELGFESSRLTELGADGPIDAERLAGTKIVNPGEILDDRIATQQILASFEIFYAYNAYQLTTEHKRQLARFTSTCPITENHRILVTSFTDSKGDDAYNIELSKKRSESVRRELVALGFPDDRIELEYHGRRVPKTMEPLDDAQRRKSLIIIYEED